MKAKNGLVLLAVVLMLGGISNHAQATIISTLSGPGSIDVGETASFLAQITASVTSGYDWEYITSVSYTFDSGDGQLSTGSLGGLWTSVLDLDASFVYDVDGSYTPTFTATVGTTDGYHYWVDTSYWQNSGYWQTYPYWCGFGTCWGQSWVDTSHWVYGGITLYGQTNLGFNTNSSTPLQVFSKPSSVPEPSTLLLLGSGLAGLGGVAWRRHRRR
jgi:hypothetical protein